jgi:hypothetical protein
MVEKKKPIVRGPGLPEMPDEILISPEKPATPQS